MAMNGIELGDEMLAAIDAAVADHAQAGPEQRRDIWRRLGVAIVAHITTHAQVTVVVASVSGVTTGLGISGPGAGTGTVS